MNAEPIKICFAGIGAVGGYYSSVLCKKFENETNIQIHLYCKEYQQEILLTQSLRCQYGEELIHTNPYAVWSTIPPHLNFDLLFICCKTYDLKVIAKTFSKHLNHNSLIIPVQNGLGSEAILADYFNHNQILPACVYIVSKLSENYEILVSKPFNKLFIKHPDPHHPNAEILLSIFNNTTAEVHFTDDIQKEMWKKFILISAVATCTCAFQKNTGSILTSDAMRSDLQSCLQELYMLSLAASIKLPSDTVNQHMQLVANFAPETFSSMYWDIKQGKQSEIESLTVFPISKAKELGVGMPTLEKLYEKIV